jgi:hypothetical protein
VSTSRNRRLQSFATKATRYRLAAAPAAIAALLLSTSTGFALDPKLESSLSNYREKYPLRNSSDKLIGVDGKVPPEITVANPKSLEKDLEGVRRFRYVLNGLLYRGGKINKAGNEYPMSNEGLNNLCEQGFGEVIYLYDSHWPKRPGDELKVSCGSHDDPLTYRTLQPFYHPENAKIILKGIKERLDHGDYRPTYVHCWNGLHASGLISALALRQFCGFTSDEALDYWNFNTEGICRGKTRKEKANFNAVRLQIENFEKIEGVDLDDELQKAVCPPKTAKVDQKAFCNR